MTPTTLGGRLIRLVHMIDFISKTGIYFFGTVVGNIACICWKNTFKDRKEYLKHILRNGIKDHDAKIWSNFEEVRSNFFQLLLLLGFTETQKGGKNSSLVVLTISCYDELHWGTASALGWSHWPFILLTGYQIPPNWQRQNEHAEYFYKSTKSQLILLPCRILDRQLLFFLSTGSYKIGNIPSTLTTCNVRQNWVQ